MRCSLAWLPLIGLFLGLPTAPGGAWEDGELLLPGETRERPITAEEAHVYRVEVADSPILVTVDQHSINLVVEARRSEDEAPLTVDSGQLRWGSEVMLLESRGEHRIEVRPRERSEGPGSYTLRIEALPVISTKAAQRRAALAAMSRASQQAFEGTPEAQRLALTTYRAVLAEWRSLGERRWEAEVTYAIAVLEHGLSELQPAIEDYLRALAIWRKLAEPRLEAAALYGLGVAHLDSGESEKARESLRQSLTLWQHLGERLDAGRSHSELCFLDHISGALPVALACYEDSLALFRELGATGDEARILNNLGGVHDRLGKPDAALNDYEQALDLRRALGDYAGEAQTLINIAVIHRVLGEWQEALRLYDQARVILAPLGDISKEASLLNNIGYTYRTLGEPERALAFFERALELYRKAGSRREELIALNNLGVTWRSLGEAQKALDHHQRALDLAVALDDRRQKAISHMRLGEVHLKRGESAGALRELDQALAHLKETGDRPKEVEILHLRGTALVLAGRPQEALPVFRDALTRRQTLRDGAGETETLHALAMTERSLGLHHEARAHAQAAMAKVEELRTGFVSPGLRAAFLATQRRAYALRIDLLMDRHAAEPGQGHDRSALEVSEQARARSLLDVLHSGASVRSGSTVPAALLDRRKSLRYLLSVKADQQLRRRESRGDEAASLTQEIEVLLSELDGVEAEIRRHDPQYAALREPRPLGLEGISGLLDPGTLLLEYSLGEERSYLWAVSAGKLQTFILPSEREIESLARRVHEELSTVEPGAAVQSEAAEALSKILLGQVWSESGRFQRLVVVPDAALHLLPFSALPVPDPGKPWETPRGIGQLLLEHFEVVYVPSATTLALQRQRLEKRPPASKWAAVLADPVFSPRDPRPTGPSDAGQRASLKDPQRGGEAGSLLPAFEPLPSSRREAKEIAGLAPAGQVWAALDFEASREAVLSGKLRDYRVVHFATHGVADARNPELSGLVLSLVDAAGRPREGFLGLSDIYELDLAAGLVVLSGCQTALGKEVRGEGVMGLTRGFLYAGVPRVVASLWRVQDRTTAELMSRFYRAMWQEGLRPAAALREAQRSLRRDWRYRDPYSWAGFVLQGDWR